jgi:hypothetical protein
MLMFFMAATANLCSATTFPPSSPLARQLAEAEVAGVYQVRSTRTVTLEDGFVTTRAQIEVVGRPLVGELRAGTLTLPGGVVGDRYVDSLEGAPQVHTGDTVLLVLRGSRDAFLLDGSFTEAFYRRALSESGPIMLDSTGRAVTAAPCDAQPVRDGQARPLTWDQAVEAFAACGGAK